jgi:hypothetical protein
VTRPFFDLFPGPWYNEKGGERMLFFAPFVWMIAVPALFVLIVLIRMLFWLRSLGRRENRDVAPTASLSLKASSWRTKTRGIIRLLPAIRLKNNPKNGIIGCKRSGMSDIYGCFFADAWYSFVIGGELHGDLRNCGRQLGRRGQGPHGGLPGRPVEVVVRYQGGNNAGHTVINEYGKFALTLLPSGIFHRDTVNLLGVARSSTSSIWGAKSPGCASAASPSRRKTCASRSGR